MGNAHGVVPNPPSLFSHVDQRGEVDHNSKPGRFAPVLRGSNPQTGGFKTKKKERKKEEAQCRGTREEGRGRPPDILRTNGPPRIVVPARTEIASFSRWEIAATTKPLHKAAGAAEIDKRKQVGR